MTQIWLVQSPLWQSELLEQALLLAHLPQTSPPQSMSVSKPSLFPLPQETVGVAVTQTLVVLLQMPVVQSLLIEQILPTAHLGQLFKPPQSMSVSNPFCDRSEQDAGTSDDPQMLAVQMPEAQSPGKEQAWPVAHGLHEPPQSISVSDPFFTLSVQVGGTQLPAEQKFD